MRLRNQYGDIVDIELSHHDSDWAGTTSWFVRTITGRNERFTSEAKAYEAFHEAMHEAFSEGFVLLYDDAPIDVPAATTFRAFPDLEAAVDGENDLTRPADEDALLVLADAWASVGDPRGDALLGGRAVSSETDDPGELARYKNLMTASRAVRDAHVLGSLGSDAYRVQVRFQRGLVFAIELHLELGAQGRTTAELITQLLANPYARFVRELSINDLDQRAIAAIGTSHASLRKLELFTRGALDLAPLDGLPHLAHLEIVAKTITGFARLPALHHLKLRGFHTSDHLVDIDAVVAWMVRHRTIETVLVQPAAVTESLETFMNVGDWPPQLRKVQVGQLARTR